MAGLDLPLAFDVLAIDHGTAHARFRLETTDSAGFEQRFGRSEAGLVAAA